MQSVTFTYSGSVVGNPPTRTITFTANDGAALSNQATRLINIVGSVVSPPVVTGTSSTPLSWTETLPPAAPPVITIAPGLAITDGSTSQLSSATVSITANFSSGEDVLGWNSAIAAANNITVSASAHSHTLTLTPTLPDVSESLASFQAVLRSVTYSDSSQNPTTAPRTITFTVVDSNSITSSITANSQQVINLTAVNNPPKVTTSAGTDSYTGGTPAILVDPTVTVTDPDGGPPNPGFNPNMVGATVSVAGGFASGDTLGFNNQAGISGSYNSATGVLTLTGSATPLDYQFALRAVTFSNPSATTSGTPRTLSFTVNDGFGNGNTATKQIAVQGGSLVLGDFNLNGHVASDDIAAMLSALTDLNSYKSAHSLSSADLLTIGDINHDGKVDNRDLQAMLSLVASLGGGSGAGSNETTLISTPTVLASAGPATPTLPLKALGAQKPAATLSSWSLIEMSSFLTMQPAATTFSKHFSATSQIVGPLPNPLTAEAVDPALSTSPTFRSRHLRWHSANQSPVNSDALEMLFSVWN